MAGCGVRSGLTIPLQRKLPSLGASFRNRRRMPRTDVRFIFLQNALVHPVPNISALQIGIFVNGLPLCPQTAGGVAHGVCVFGWHDRTVTAFFAYRFKPACARILRNEHIGIPFPLCAFVVHRAVHAFGFTVFHPKVSLIEIISVSGFITQ